MIDEETIRQRIEEEEKRLLRNVEEPAKAIVDGKYDNFACNIVKYWGGQLMVTRMLKKILLGMTDAKDVG